MWIRVGTAGWAGGKQTVGQSALKVYEDVMEEVGGPFGEMAVAWAGWSKLVFFGV